MQKHQITIIYDDEETTINTKPKHTILDGALLNDVDVPYSCQGGTCRTCLAKLTEGSVDMERTTALSNSEIEKGYILTCQAKPTSNKVIVNYDEV